jgi:hypothetical protein
VVFVLDVKSSSYAEAVANAGDGFLGGCRCASCQGTDVRLTGSRVERRLETPELFVTLQVALARCHACRHRERVLPWDALPGKVTGVEVILDAAADALTDGTTVSRVAEGCGVAARTVRSWILGLGARVLDLERLFRHRAGHAPPDAPMSALLHRWAAVAVELCRRRSVALGVSWMPGPRRSAAEERREGQRHQRARRRVAALARHLDRDRHEGGEGADVLGEGGEHGHDALVAFS